MWFKQVVFFCFFGSMLIPSMHAIHTDPTGKDYIKEYHANGHLKAEGWSCMDLKMAFWYFYHPNGEVASKGRYQNNQKEGYWYYYDSTGAIIKEGHYAAGVASSWWIFYDIALQTESKFEYQNNRKNGFALIYINDRLKRAEKYQDDRKIGEWTSIWAFKRDNPEASF
jgi:antitoxin component YwqK of YwqJK toxin-antitoxin module